MPGKKSSYHARKFLNAGNAKLKKQKFYEALESFNKCLCLAEPKSQENLLAYASRAKVFQEVERRSSENPWNFFQLSYPANEKIPNVANCLELKSDPNFGRFIVALHDLKPGDVIAIEEPFFKIIDTTATHLRCSNCLKSNNMNLVPSDLCSSSKLRRKFSSQTFHELFLSSQACSAHNNVLRKRRKTSTKLK